MRAYTVPIAATVTLHFFATCIASAAEPAGAAQVAPVSAGSLVQVLLALLVVLAAIVLFAWLIRRFVPGQGLAAGIVRVVGGVMVGARERLVVVEVGDTWLLLGVTASQVSLVHSMPKPDLPAGAPGVEQRSFARLLGQVRAARARNAG